MGLLTIIRAMQHAGADRIVLKELSPNDNSKNQIYVARGARSEVVLRELRVDLEAGDVTPSTIRIPQKASWIDLEGNLAPAPSTKVIFYPDYPELRISGFARGVPAGFSGRDLVVRRGDGRVLLIGLTASDGWLLWAAQLQPNELEQIGLSRLQGLPLWEVASSWRSPDQEIWGDLMDRVALLAEGPILPSVRLNADGTETPTNPSNPHAGGWALEAALGVPVNALPGPDFRGLVELKAFSGSRISLMTPEPTGGLYAERGEGKRDFLARWGTLSSDGAKRRFNGQHRLNEPKTSNPLTLRVEGWSYVDPGKYAPDAALKLVDSDGVVGASWMLKDLNAKWLNKHDQALYVNYRREGAGFRLTGRVHRCHVTDFRLFMLGLRAGSVIFDPGHSMVVTTGVVSPRSQWRTSKSLLLGLYDEVAELDLLA